MSHNPKAPFERTDTPIKVAVLSDDSLLAAALSSLLGQQGGVEVTALAQADVALWDPGADASRLEPKLAELSDLAPPTLALVPSIEQAPLALEAGARGVMLRDHVGPHLISALRAVQGGLTVLDTSLADNLVGGRPMLSPQLREALTARERDNKQIAGRLDISEHTAKFHIGRILEKLDSDTRTEAVVRALRHGLVSV
jgi:DNA-binding NarL/FixJ family response regulator